MLTVNPGFVKPYQINHFYILKIEFFQGLENFKLIIELIDPNEHEPCWLNQLCDTFKLHEL